jgi:SAM-dependent MidA family methyltransferase
MPPAPADEKSDLLAIVRARIRRDGPMPVDAYMRLCLADPDHGYWRKSHPIGAGGDFITAPEISQAFGELIGLWCAVVWQAMGRPSPLRLVELGPGRGTLMRDALRAAERVPGFVDAATVHLVEVGGHLRELQRQTLASSPRGGREVVWHEAMDEVPEGHAIVIANEFLDALPIRQLLRVEGAWHERVVGTDAAGALVFGVGPRVAGVDEPAPPQPGAILELRAAENQLLAVLAGRRAPHASLFIDYGPAASAYGDTLQAVRRHAYADPLVSPGDADLTAHVQFATLARKARSAGLAADGPITQAAFLACLGMAERTARLMAANPRQAGVIEAATQRLMSPTGMGGLCKVLVVRSHHLPPPPPFV